MGLTLSHFSALDTMRTLRSERIDFQKLDSTSLRPASTWVGRHWTKKAFAHPDWRWSAPSQARPLDVIVPNREGYIRMANVRSHTMWRNLPAGSILWLDKYSSIVCPELLFLEIAETFPLPTLVLLGYELCGNFSRCPNDPRNGKVTMGIPAASSVEKLGAYLDCFTRSRGLARARKALHYVADNALSAPEAVLATMYSLPRNEDGYGMAPITLNKRVDPLQTDPKGSDQRRYPDILFPFAPVGINYDGEDHLDLDGLIDAARRAEHATGEDTALYQAELAQKARSVRAKVVDDGLRNRQLLTRGHIVIPATKEDLASGKSLDALTRDILIVANTYFGANTSEYMRALKNTEQARDRSVLLSSLLPSGKPSGPSRDLI